MNALAKTQITLRNAFSHAQQFGSVISLKSRRANAKIVSGSGSYQCDLSIHDHHRLELKSVIEFDREYSPKDKKFQQTIDFYMFFPQTFNLQTWSKDTLTTDFKSNIRLSVPLHVPDVLQTGINKLVYMTMNYCEHRLAFPNEYNIYTDDLVTLTKKVAAIWSEKVKRKKSEHGFELRGIISGNDKGPEKLKKAKELMESMDTITQELSSMRRDLNLYDPQIPDIVKLFDEFVSSLYIQYLGRLRQELRRSRTQEFIQIISVKLDQLQNAEAQHWKKMQYLFVDSSRGEKLELEFARLSQLKKFFQSTLFFEVSRRDSVKALTQPIAAMASALAAVWFILFQRYSVNQSSLLSSVGLSSLSFMTAAVLAYVIRDRMKDWVKIAFDSKARSILPDHEYQLFGQTKYLGVVKEWLTSTSKKNIPKEVILFRNGFKISEVETELPEDVLHYRRALDLKPKLLQWGVRETLRINIERHLRNLDDPFRSLMLLDKDGNLKTKKSHRTYSILACLIVNSQTPNEYLRMYRIVMDKSGLTRLHELTSPN